MTFFTTDRRAGDARAPGRLAQVLKSKRLRPAAARAQQVHGAKIKVVPRLARETLYRGIDGFLTDQPDQPLAIFTADCVPIFLSDPKQGVAGLLHAGWRGVRGRILARATALMKRRWKSSARSIETWVGPSIGPCCFEVGWEVARYFPFSRRRKKDKWHVDLAREIKRQAERLGLHWSSSKTISSCTRHTHRWHSYRRDKTPHRMVSVIQVSQSNV